MAKTFHGAALALLIKELTLLPVEKQVILALQVAHANDEYADALNRMPARFPDYEIIVTNIRIKAERAGLHPVLELLREMSNEVPVEEHQEDRVV
jgi:hypothetical protein